MRALEFLEGDLKRKDKEFNVPDAIEIMEPTNVDQELDKSDSFDFIFASNSGTEGTKLEGGNKPVTTDTFEGIVALKDSSNISAYTLESSQSSQSSQIEGTSERLIEYHITKVAKKSIHRIYPHSDTWSCDFCKVRDDKWGMAKHTCAGILKAAAVSSSGLNHSNCSSIDFEIKE